ncbi:DoxX family protein [Niveispirillum sp. KHB5.9]|uniref:DoxX family protein n=1 Tax=Niveispirillum sp. KHB5.9 TaxID=3400269 RepID=UPI003A87CA8C
MNEKMKRLLLHPPVRVGEDVALLVLRLMVGAFLVWGVADNILSAERMEEFVRFLEKFGFPLPELMARLSVYAQFLCGLGFMLGLSTRWAAILCIVNFIVAIVMVDHVLGIRGMFPSACLIAIGLLLLARGPGRYGLDGVIAGRG